MKVKFAYLATAAFAAIALGTGAHAATNLVVNGDFEAGNTGFGSDYAFVSGPGSATPPAVYAIDTSPSNVHPAWASFGDHTSGSGKMMIVNGSEVGGERVWYENGVGVAQNTTYFFSTWIRSVYDQSPAQLNFSINLNGIGTTFTAGAIADGWQQFFASWNSGSATTANIALINQNTAFTGNDFALDDISLSTTAPNVPEPGAWALMILGFGAVGSVLRRRRVAVVA
ncbi:MAG: PEPxxWA-CTERM sorting domain-containing protein [Phenylobacterium sp.]